MYIQGFFFMSVFFFREFGKLCVWHYAGNNSDILEEFEVFDVFYFFRQGLEATV